MPVLNPEHLFDQAEKLTALPAAAGAPRQADLRRAISSTYYGLFHTVLMGAADAFVGSTKRETHRYALVYRSISHTSLRSLCEDTLKKTLPAKYQNIIPKSGFSDDLKAFATALIDLQEKRHMADYDPLYRVSTTDAVIAIKTGRTAYTRFGAAGRIQKKNFLALAVFKPR